MEYLVVTALTVGCIALAAAAAIIVRRPTPDPTSWLDDMVRRRALFQLVGGETVDGVIVRLDHDGVELASVRHENRAISGTAWVPRERIRWVQRPEDTRSEPA